MQVFHVWITPIRSSHVLTKMHMCDKYRAMKTSMKTARILIVVVAVAGFALGASKANASYYPTNTYGRTPNIPYNAQNFYPNESYDYYSNIAGLNNAIALGLSGMPTSSLYGGGVSNNGNVVNSNNTINSNNNITYVQGLSNTNTYANTGSQNLGPYFVPAQQTYYPTTNTGYYNYPNNNTGVIETNPNYTGNTNINTGVTYTNTNTNTNTGTNTGNTW